MSPIRDMSPGLARHLNYSEHMSVDASMVVPDIENRSRGQSIFFGEFVGISKFNVYCEISLLQRRIVRVGCQSRTI